MDNFKTFLLNEKFLNLFPKDTSEKEKYADKVWDMLQKSYASAGGIKGSGFSSKQDMINNIPFWKILKKNNEAIGALMYKDKGGRKRVATCTDGTKSAKIMLANAMKQEPNRAFFEVSKKSWFFIRNLLDTKDLKSFMKTPTDAGLYLKKEIVELKDIPIADLDASGLNPNDPANKPFEKFIYGRKINGGLQAKVMIGSVGKLID